jgi:DegV family protein with EDD domain
MIRVVTDTDSNIPQRVIDEYNIGLVPIHIIFGEDIVREHFEITPSEAFERMAAAPELPKTSQPPVGEFKTLYDGILAEDPDVTILSLHISGDMSGTVESARQAAGLLPDADIRVMDTRSASLGQALMVREAAQMARQGAGADAIMQRLKLMRDRTQVYLVVKTLEYLAKGGRIGHASHLLGNVLAIKPVLKVTDGVLDAHDRYRTWKRAMTELRDLVTGQIPAAAQRPAGETLHLGVCHGVNEADASPLYQELVEQLQPDVTMFSEVGPGLGVHVGPGIIAVCWAVMPEHAP